MPNYKQENRGSSVETQPSEESLRQEHQALNAMLAYVPECTGIILRMRAIEKQLNG